MRAHVVGTGGRAASVRRRLAACTLTVGLVTSALAVSGTASTARAADAPTGSVSGRVTAPDGTGIAGVRVGVSGYPSGGRATTAADGTYRVDGLAARDYAVEFDASRTPYASERWRDADWGGGSSGKVIVATGAHVQHVDAELDLAGRVTGVVTGPDGAPADDLYVSLTRAGDPVAMASHVAAPNRDGSYTIENVRPGDYVVEFDPHPGVNLASEYAGDSPTAEGSDVLTVTAGGAVRVDAQLATGATMTGRVTGPDGAPLAGVQVRTTGAGDPTLEFTDDDGRYEAVGLPTGDVTVLFLAAQHPTLAHEYHADARSAGAATPVHLDPTQPAPVVDAQLTPGGSVTGRVTDLAGKPFEGMTVWAIAPDSGIAWETAPTDANGVYTLQGLPQAPFVVKFGSDTWGGSHYWRDADTVETATPVTVGPGEVRRGVDGRVRAGFADVPISHPFAMPIEWLGVNGISRGTLMPDGRVLYEPTGTVRREAMAAFLYRAAGSPAFTPPAVSPFRDVPVGAPFYTEITWLAARGISTGTAGDDEALFRPAEPVTREVMAVFLYRFHGSRELTVPEPYPFSDLTAADRWATEIAWLPTAGISTGTDVGGGRKEFRPDEPVSREAMAAFLYRGAHNVS